MRSRSSTPEISLALLVVFGLTRSSPVEGLQAAPVRYLVQRGTVSGQVVLPSGHQVNHRIKVTLSIQDRVQLGIHR